MHHQLKSLLTNYVRNTVYVVQRPLSGENLNIYFHALESSKKKSPVKKNLAVQYALETKTECAVSLRANVLEYLNFYTEAYKKPCRTLLFGRQLGVLHLSPLEVCSYFIFETTYTANIFKLKCFYVPCRQNYWGCIVLGISDCLSVCLCVRFPVKFFFVFATGAQFLVLLMFLLFKFGLWVCQCVCISVCEYVCPQNHALFLSPLQPPHPPAHCPNSVSNDRSQRSLRPHVRPSTLYLRRYLRSFIVILRLLLFYYVTFESVHLSVCLSVCQLYDTCLFVCISVHKFKNDLHQVHVPCLVCEQIPCKIRTLHLLQITDTCSVEGFSQTFLQGNRPKTSIHRPIHTDSPT